MSAKRFVIALQEPGQDLRRTLEAFDLAAGLAAFDHDVTLVLCGRSLSRLAAAQDDPEVAERLELLSDAGITRAWTGAADAPARLGPLAVAPHEAPGAGAPADVVIRL